MGILVWESQLLAGISLPWAGLQQVEMLQALAGEEDRLPCPALSSQQRHAGSRSEAVAPSSTQPLLPPEHWQVVIPRPVCLLHTTARRWQRATQLHPTLP